MDYSAAATGLSATVFDRVLVRPDWAAADLAATCAGLVDAVLSEDAVFVPGLDLEAALLAERHPGQRALLLPGVAAFDAVRKPGVEAARLLGLRVPAYLLAAGIEDATEFAVAHGWRIWVKGPRYEATAPADLTALSGALHRARVTWGAGEVLLQQHVDGVEESIVFAALDGVLLGAAAMRKTLVTPEGKTWAGAVEPVEHAGLVEFVRHTGWTGGGEVEMVRDDDGDRHLLEVNPRFPAWVHGATLAGINLPARLVSAATGSSTTRPESLLANGFVRVVEEIPAAPRLLGARAAGAPAWPTGGKHPSAMPVLARRLAAGPVPTEPLDLDERTAADVAATLPVDPGDSPARVLLRPVLDRRIAALTGVARAVAGASGVPTGFAYSVKTNPDPRVLDAVLRADAGAEVISQAEARRCAAAGFPADRVVLNGPAKWWRFDGVPAKYGAVFCDSLADLTRTVDLIRDGSVHTDVLGVRLAPPGVPSRFGVDVSDPTGQARLVDALRAAPVGRIGLHFHCAASRIGQARWLREFTIAITAAADLCARAGVRVQCLDLGGGWSPATRAEDLTDALVRAVRVATDRLGTVDQVLFEPGKYLVEPAMAVFSTVLDVRDGPAGRAAVVDASVAELPDWTTHPHPVLWRPPGANWRRLGPGDEAVLGRLCMEHDRPREGLALPPGLRAGDHLLFLDAGGYDASMSYQFGV
ncbi:ATP-grasp domain-containing protein [Actinokineospora sp. NBRC 105648]|uniref:ATP-grasp domain-containing protein n=1 Tax=Actinokineospora sp. NBRC 105648 TaxID=3032206 RepID=UPI002553F99F|nr:ATP-grasp domain-containing protein [Actinokineospora sp. NBRC 105648]